MIVYKPANLPVKLGVNSMRAGFASVDITPPVGIPMGGNIRDDISSRGSHDPLKADVIAFENRGTGLVLVDLDWCEAPLEVIRGIKKQISAVTGVGYPCICITMTHTHSAPDTTGSFNISGITDGTRDYISKAASDIAGAVGIALDNLQEVLTGVGKCTEESLSFNRRVFFRDGNLHMNWEILENPDIRDEDIGEPEGPVDPDLYVLKICDPAGGLKAVVVNFTLHPAVLVMQDWLFSKDYIWGMEKAIKQKYGEDVLIYFANGAEGNVNHIDIHDRNQKRGWEEAERIGARLGGRVCELLDSIAVKEPCRLNVKFGNVFMPIREITEEEIEQAGRIAERSGGVIHGQTDGVPEEWYAENILKIAGCPDKTRELEFHVIDMGDFMIATLPGELFVEFGLEIKARSRCKNTLLFGLANQSIGYIPTPRAFKNGGYEPTTCEFSILAPEAGDMIVNKILEMIG